MATQLFFLVVLAFSYLFQHSQSKTVVIDGLAEWKNPTIHVGDTLIFKYKHLNRLYIFRNRKAFDLCNFTQANLLTNSANSTSFMWLPYRPGFFYFSYNNGSLDVCQRGEKVAIRVFQKPPEELAPLPSAAPSPTSGGTYPSSPAYILPNPAVSPAKSPSSSPVPVPSILPDSGSGIPFINSNPAVPLPNGETDSTTIRPLPTSGYGCQDKMVVVGSLLQIQLPVWLLFRALYLF